MDTEGVLPLIIVVLLVAGPAMLGIASRRKKLMLRTETETFATQIGGIWHRPDGNSSPLGRPTDPVTGAALSERPEPFDRALEFGYRDRSFLAIEYTTVSTSGTRSNSRTARHLIQMRKPATARLTIVPKLLAALLAAPAGMQPVLSGDAEFDRLYAIHTDDELLGQAVARPEVLAWFVALPRQIEVRCAGEILAISGIGTLPGYGLATIANQLADLDELVLQGRLDVEPRLELKPQEPEGNKAIKTAAGLTIAAGLLVWIVGFTISDPAGGLVVIGIIAGLCLIAILITFVLRRRGSRAKSE